MRRLSSLALAFAIVGWPSQSAAQWVLEPMGSLDDLGQTFASSINNSGHVVGGGLAWTGDNFQGTVPFLWTRAGGFQTFAGRTLSGHAVDINDRHQVIGVTPGGGFVWSERTGLVELVAFLPYKINNRGNIAGECRLDVFVWRPCIWSDGTTTLIDVPGNGAATAISAGHVVAGYYVSPVDGSYIGFVWQRHLGVRHLESAPGVTLVFDVDDSGNAVGTTGERVAVWNTHTGTRRAAPDISGDARAINGRGVIVGNDWEAGRAFAWVPGSQPVYLPSGPADYTTAMDINASGDIVGSICVGGDCEYQAYGAVWRAQPR
jgi:hypothetical protein